MKKLIFLLSLSLFVLSCTSKQENSSAGSDTPVNPDNVVTLDVNIEGMTCTGCESTIKEGLSELPGVVEVEAYHVDGKAFVKYDSSLTAEKDISRMIEQRGYKVTSLEKAKSDELQLE